MKGKEILDAVRLLIGDESYADYFDINRAYRDLCSDSDHRFLSRSSTSIVGFSPSTNTYTINLNDVDSIDRVYVRGGINSGTRIAAVQSKNLATPPTSVSNGARYIVAASPTGDWSGFSENDVTTASVTAGVATWAATTPILGYTALVEDEDRHYRYTGSTWELVPVSSYRWIPLDEQTPAEFELSQPASVSGAGVEQRMMPRYFKLTGGPVATMTITPTPDREYDVRVDYVGRPSEIGPEVTPLIPIAFHDTLVDLATAYAILRRGPADRGPLAQVLLDKVRLAMRNIRDFSHRTKQSVDRKPRSLVR